MRYALDTNALSEWAKPRPNPGFMARAAAPMRVAVPSPVWQEAWFGVRRLASGRRRAELEGFLTGFVRGVADVLPFDRDAAEWMSAERARLVASATPPSYSDAQIAAVAVTRGLILVTRNVSDFQRFKDLVVENWWT